MTPTRLYDKRGIPIERGDIVKVFHFIGARRKRHYMFKQCLGVGTYRQGGAEYMFFSHLNFNDEIGKHGPDSPYHESLDRVLPDYEIVQSIKCDHEARSRRTIGKDRK
ncbi:MAG TPA: hypothetical protein VFT89_07235 [Rhizobiaceae bacterium]|nr:hypothetical protein [Rhizobiaceae bacterium]